MIIYLALAYLVGTYFGYRAWVATIREQDKLGIADIIFLPLLMLVWPFSVVARLIFYSKKNWDNPWKDEIP